MATTPRARSASDSCTSLLQAPRSLKEAVNWWFSNFRNTSTPVICDSVREGMQGVSCTCPCRRRAACSTSLASIMGGIVRLPHPHPADAGRPNRRSNTQVNT